MAGHHADSGEMISEINVTPLVDVMLVLLIILMVTTSYAVAHSMGVELPKSASGNESGQSLVVTVEADGSWQVDDRPVDEAALRQRARAGIARDRQLKALVAADGSAAHRHVVGVMDVLRQEGVNKVAIGVRPEAE